MPSAFATDGEGLIVAELRASLAVLDADDDLAERLRHLIEADRAVADELTQVAEVERLILYKRWLLALVNNFVNFSHFYDPAVRSAIEADEPTTTCSRVVSAVMFSEVRDGTL